MTPNWNEYRVLKKTGPLWNWGEPDRMEPNFLGELDKFLAEEKLEPFISTGTQGKHAEDSKHYAGEAVDIMFPRVLRRDLPDVHYAALRYGFTGIGLYSEWRLSPQGRPLGGLHLQWCPTDTSRAKLWLWGPKGQEALKFARVKELFQ